MFAAHNPPNHIVYYGGTMATVISELELGHRAAFDLDHLDNVMFCWCGLIGECWFCRHTPESMDWRWK